MVIKPNYGGFLHISLEIKRRGKALSVPEDIG
jgi:hypothetical protein